MLNIRKMHLQVAGLPGTFSDIWQSICERGGQGDDCLVCYFPFTIWKIKIEMTTQYVSEICILVLQQVLTDDDTRCFMPAKEMYSCRLPSTTVQNILLVNKINRKYSPYIPQVSLKAMMN